MISVSLAQEKVRKGTWDKDWEEVQKMGQRRGVRKSEGGRERVSSLRFSAGP